MHILYVAFESAPFAASGGLGEVAGPLPPALLAGGADIRVILPKHGSIDENYKRKMKKIYECDLEIGWHHQYCGIETLTHRGVRYYFVDNEQYFKRDAPYGYEDDGERVVFFCRAVVEWLWDLSHNRGFEIDLIHANDWHASLVPVFLREHHGDDPFYQRIKTVITVHNLKHQGWFKPYYLGDMMRLAGYSRAEVDLAYGDRLNFLKGGLLYSDMITTVSPSYALEIQGQYYGEQLDPILRLRAQNVVGILNGIDKDVYDPVSDPLLYYPFDDTFEGKAQGKAALQEAFALPVKAKTPLLVMVSRLVEQKGFDLLRDILDELLKEDVQLVVIGSGDKCYSDMLLYFAAKYPQKMIAWIGFDQEVAHRIYAAGDIYLMPSRFEPCGIAQMIAMGYGTVPVVRETGGLRDSVKPYWHGREDADGIGFTNYDSREFLDAIHHALHLYRQEPKVWRRLMCNGFHKDFSWERSALHYLEIYRDLLGEGSE